MTSQAFRYLLQPLELGFTQIRNRVLMGSMHTGLEDMRGGFDKLAAFYRERALGGVGLIVSGGISPDLCGRLTPFSSQLSYRWQTGRHRKLTQVRARYWWKNLHAGTARRALRDASARARAFVDQIAGFAIYAARDVGGENPAHYQCVRAYRGTGARRRLRRRRDHGFGRLSDQPVSVQSYQYA